MRSKQRPVQSHKPPVSRTQLREMHVIFCISLLSYAALLLSLKLNPPSWDALESFFYLLGSTLHWLMLPLYLGILGVRFDPSLNNEASPLLLPKVTWTLTLTLPKVTEPPILTSQFASVGDLPPPDFNLPRPLSQFLLAPSPLRGPPVPVR